MREYLRPSRDYVHFILYTCSAVWERLAWLGLDRTLEHHMYLTGHGRKAEWGISYSSH